jgi:hypothetical protein
VLVVVIVFVAVPNRPEQYFTRCVGQKSPPGAAPALLEGMAKVPLRAVGAATLERMTGSWSGLLAGLVAAAALAAEASAGIDARLDELFGEHLPYRQFLGDLQSAVTRGPRERVASLVSYPLRTRVGGRSLTIRTPAQFVADYDRLLPPSSIAAIRHQAYAELFANANGVMIGSGEVWFSAVCASASCDPKVIRIVALNPAAEKR